MKSIDCLLVGYAGNNLEMERRRLQAVSNKPVNIENPFSLAIAYLGTYHKKISFEYIISFEDEQHELIDII